MLFGFLTARGKSLWNWTIDNNQLNSYCLDEADYNWKKYNRYCLIFVSYRIAIQLIVMVYIFP